MQRKPISMILSLLLALGLLLSACGGLAGGGDANGPINLTDGLDRTVSLAGPAQKIVSLAPSNTEILFAIGAGGQMVGRDMFSDYPPEALEVADVGGSYGELNTEAIVALEPDLVLAAEINTAEQVQALEALGLTVYYLANPATLDGLYENIAVVAQLTGHTTEAEILVEALKARVAAVDAALAGVTEIPMVFYELDGSDPNAPWTAGAGTFIDTLIAKAKGRNIGNVLEGDFPQISIEVIVTEDPMIILLGDAAYGVTPELVAARAGWEGLSAVVNGQVFPFDDNLVSRPGPRLIDGLEALAALLHPGLFTK